jgi:hypothetical protein
LLNAAVNVANIRLKLRLTRVSPLALASTEWYRYEGKTSSVPSFTRTHHDLIGVSGSEFRDRWSDDAGLAARVVEVDAVGAGAGAHVVHRAQEIVGVAVRAVRGARRIQVHPAAGDFDRWFANFQEPQHARRRPADAVAKGVQLLAPVQGMARLPGFAGLQLRLSLPQRVQQSECGCVDRFVDLGAKLDFPDQGRKKRNDVRVFDPRVLAGYCHAK